MKKILCAIMAAIMLMLTSAALVSCGDDDGIEIPEDMQLVRESKEDGYIFFGPEGWTVANQGDIAATFVTTFNKTSITFVKAAPPAQINTDGLPETGEDGKKIDYNKVRFDNYMNETAKGFAYELTPELLSGSKTNFGANGAEATLAYEYTYSYTAEGETVSCWQILLTRGTGAEEDFFIFTYTSFGKASDDTSAYSIYLPKAKLAAKNFKFTEKSASLPSTEPDYPKDNDGYLLVSDESICGFKLYIPESFTVVDNSGLVSAKITDKANFNVFKATDTNIGALDYMLRRRESAMASADKDSFKDIEILIAQQINDEHNDYFEQIKWDERCTIRPVYDPELKFGNAVAGQIVAYKYSYSHGGNEYVCYMIYGVSPGVIFRDGYIFTYTATKDEFDAHWAEIETVLEKIEFN